MTAKQFFKSNVFKCIIALLCVLLVSGVFLTLMNALMHVSDEERLDRAISKIYGKSVNKTSVAVSDHYSDATIEEAYHITDDGNYLIKSTGKGGFDNGTVTCWVVVEVSGSAITGIGKVVVDSNKGQTQMAELKDSFYNKFSTGYSDGLIYYTTGDGFMVTNSTKSSAAVCNAVNGALEFVRNQPGITSGVEDKYTEFDYIDNILTTLCDHVIDEANNTVTFTVVSKGYGNPSNFKCDITVDSKGEITAFKIVENGSTGDSYEQKVEANVQKFVGKNLEQIKELWKVGETYPVYGDKNFGDMVSGATESTYTAYTAALFAVANYDKVLKIEAPAPDEQPEESEGGENNE